MTRRHVMKLHPWNDVVASAGDLINKGLHVYQQFNCEKCGAKQTMDVPDKLYISGICEECGHETDIVKNGCNYMVHAVTRRAVEAVLKTMGEKKP
jgi:hypothetical protein